MVRGCQRDEHLGELEVGPMVTVTWKRVWAQQRERTLSLKMGSGMDWTVYLQR